jgi:hypothetical protein
MITFEWRDTGATPARLRMESASSSSPFRPRPRPPASSTPRVLNVQSAVEWKKNLACEYDTDRMMKRSTQIIFSAIKQKTINPNLASSILIDGSYAIEIQNAAENVAMSSEEVISDVIDATEELCRTGLVRTSTVDDLKAMAAEYLE